MTPARRMLHRLAVIEGDLDVGRVGSRLTAEKFAEWCEFFAIEPWGFEQDWLRAGTVGAAIYNAAPFRGENAPTIRPSQFVPKPIDPEFAAKLAAARAAAESATRKSRPGILKGKTTKSLRKLREERRGR